RPGHLIARDGDLRAGAAARFGDEIALLRPAACVEASGGCNIAVAGHDVAVSCQDRRHAHSSQFVLLDRSQALSITTPNSRMQSRQGSPMLRAGHCTPVMLRSNGVLFVAFTLGLLFATAS